MHAQLETIIAQLHTFLATDQLSTNETVRENHGRDESYHEMALPDIVVFPHTTDEVAQIMRVAYTYEIAVIPFGVGSSLEGHIIPVTHTLTIDFSQMNQILEIRPEDLLVRVQPGVTRTQLNKELKKHGLFFSVDPGADATLGGMAATNASGTTAVRYGVMRDQVRDLEVVLADGRIMHTGNLAAKSSSGYHLNGLFVGSEGTLGCFTELTLKVYGIPEFEMAARAVFPTVRQAIEAATMVLQAGVPIARIELVDEQSMQQVNAYSGTDYLIKPTLFLEFHGNEAGLKQDVEFTTDIMNDNDCLEIFFETDNKARHELWEARHNLAYAYIHGYPGKKMMTTDVVVPIGSLADAIEFARQLIDEVGMIGGVLGHVGDGNFHSLVMIDVNNPDDVARAKAYNARLVEFGLEHGGTCTGEHGVGIGKMIYQSREHGEALNVMRAIKQTLDPKNILNPHKLIADA